MSRSPTLLVNHSRWFTGRQFVGMRAGKFYFSLRGPEHRPLFSERNRIRCRVLPLLNGWRFVVKVDA